MTLQPDEHVVDDLLGEITVERGRSREAQQPKAMLAIQRIHVARVLDAGRRKQRIDGTPHHERLRFHILDLTPGTPESFHVNQGLVGRSVTLSPWWPGRRYSLAWAIERLSVSPLNMPSTQITLRSFAALFQLASVGVSQENVSAESKALMPT